MCETETDKDRPAPLRLVHNAETDYDRLRWQRCCSVMLELKLRQVVFMSDELLSHYRLLIFNLLFCFYPCCFAFFILFFIEGGVQFADVNLKMGRYRTWFAGSRRRKDSVVPDAVKRTH